MQQLMPQTYLAPSNGQFQTCHMDCYANQFHNGNGTNGTTSIHDHDWPVDMPLVCLLDTCSMGTTIQTRALSPCIVENISSDKRIATTETSPSDTSRSMELQNIQLPEFVNIRVVGVEARLFHSPECRDGIIFGRDFLQASKMKFCFYTNTVNWLGVTLDTKQVDHYMIDDAIVIGLQPRGSYKENIRCDILSLVMSLVRIQICQGLG